MTIPPHSPGGPSGGTSRSQRIVLVAAAVLAAGALGAAAGVVLHLDRGSGKRTSTNPSGSASLTPATSPNSTPTSRPTAQLAQALAVPVYVVGETERGPRLYREFRRIRGAAAAPARAALIAMGDQPADPDYRTLWPGLRVLALSRAGDLATVRVSQAPTGDAPRQAAVQQLVYTVTAADRAVHRVRITGTGLPASAFAQPFSRLPQAQIVAPVWIHVPTDGATVAGRFVLAGTASVSEATVSIEVVRDSTVVRQSSATATVGAPGRGTWAARLSLPPGRYTIRAFETSPEDGSAQYVDTKRITVR